MCPEKRVEAGEPLFDPVHGRLRAVRKDIARIYTIMRERELGITPMLEMSDDAGDGEEGAA